MISVWELPTLALICIAGGCCCGVWEGGSDLYGRLAVICMALLDCLDKRLDGLHEEPMHKLVICKAIYLLSLSHLHVLTVTLYIVGGANRCMPGHRGAYPAVDPPIYRDFNKSPSPRRTEFR